MSLVRSIFIALAALLFSALLWAYVRLSSAYESDVDLLVQLTPPKNYALSSGLPPHIHTRLRGAGWQIMLMNFTNTSKISLDLSERAVGGAVSTLILRGDEIANAAVLPSDLRVLKVDPDSIRLDFTKAVQKEIAIIPRIDVTTAKGFVLGTTSVTPAHVTITGASTFLDSLQSISTTVVSVSNAKEPIDRTVTLSDSMKNFVTILNEPKITVHVNVEPVGERTVQAIPVTIEALPPDYELVLIPNSINVILRAGVDELAHVKPAAIRARVIYDPRQFDTAHTIVPHVEVPQNMTYLASDPRALRFIVRKGANMLLHEASFVVVDVETTGLSAHNGRITELGMVRFESGKIVDTLHTLLNPEQFIPTYITKMTGITNAMVYGKPRFGEMLPDIKRFLSAKEATVFTGHNVKFDFGFVSESFMRAGDRLVLGSTSGAEHLLCTCRLARRLLPKLKSKSLKNVQDYFGIKNSRQHRASADAEATALILGRFIDMAGEMQIETLEDLIKLQYAKPNYGRRKTKRETSLRDKVRTFPERPGVYMMHGSAGEVLYVGKAKSLRDRVANYFSTANTQGTKLTQLMRLARDITYEETGTELSALLLESRRIKEHTPRFNSVDRFYKGQAFVRLDVQNPFPTLDVTREPAQDGAEYYGPFKWPSSAEALVDVLNRAFKLRECADQFHVGPEQRPCLYYEIKRCDAPCALLISEQDYRKEVDRVRTFLASGEAGILSHVEELMKDCADRLDFEEAQFFKIRLMELERVLGRGERTDASISGNDFVILTPVVSRDVVSGCEVLMMRFGRLVKQMTFNATHIDIAESWFTRQLRMYYGATPAIPPTAGKPEVDEMRIITRWVEQNRKKGIRIVYIDANWETSVVKLVAKLKEVLGVTEVSLLPVIAPRERRFVLKPMQASTP